MSRKERGACDKLNVALAGIDSAVVTLETFLGEDAKREGGPIKPLIEAMKEYSEAARDHLLTIRFHLGQL